MFNTNFQLVINYNFKLICKHFQHSKYIYQLQAFPKHLKTPANAKTHNQNSKNYNEVKYKMIEQMNDCLDFQ